jgi:hypothetical protein
MAESEGDLILQLGLTMTRLNRQLAAAEQRFSRAAEKIERGFNASNTRAIEATIAQTSRLETAFQRVGRVAGTVLGVVIGQGLLQIATRARTVISALDEIAKTADRVGVGLEEFQALQFGFGLEGVSEQDFSKALETFSLRIGEAAEGSGELYKRLRDNGIAIRDASGEIRPLNVLLREYADLVARTGSEAAQMALITDAFGRGGRDLANALRGGAEGMDEMIAAAREAGVVLEESVLRRAEALDDQFSTLTAQMSVYLKQVAVFGGEAVLGWKMMMDDLLALFNDGREIDAILQGNANAAAVLGESTIAAMDNAGDATEAQAIAAQQLISIYNQLSGQVTNLAEELDIAAASADALGRTEAAEALRKLGEYARVVDEAFQAGSMSADEFSGHLSRIAELATNVLIPLQSIDNISFDSAIYQVKRLAIALYDAAVQAATLRSELPGTAPFMPVGGPGTFPVGDNSDAFNSPTPTAPRNVPRPPRRPADIDFGYTPATGGGRSSGGSGATVNQGLSPWFDEAQEQQILDAVKALTEAQEKYNDAVERGANTVADFFTSIVDGSKSAKEALADLLIQLAQVQFQKAFLGLASGGGTVGNIFGALGNALTVPKTVPNYDGGGYTGGGARTGGIDGKGGFPALLHPNETVIDHTKPGNAGGGQVSVVVRMDGGNLVPVIESVSGNVTAKAMASYDRQLNARIRQANGDRRAL